MRVRFLIALAAILVGSCSVSAATVGQTIAAGQSAIRAGVISADKTSINGCGSGRVGDVNGIGGDEPTIGDISFLINAKFISLSCDSIPCLAEADINQSGGANPTCDDLSIGDIMILIDYLFITGSDNMTLPECLGGTVTDIDGNVYQTVTIGEQVWMAENLKVTHYRNGDSIPNIEQPAEWLAQTDGAYCNYGNDTSMGSTYGRLYNFAAVADSRGLAPVGWHVATDAEWQTLIDTLGGDVVAGDRLKEAGTAHWSGPNSGTNESGFCALPGGSRQYEGAFLDLSVYGVFWSSTEHSADFAWLRVLYYATGYIQTGGAYKPYGYSVRCVRD